jgi:hypothetical protein
MDRGDLRVLSVVAAAVRGLFAGNRHARANRKPPAFRPAAAPGLPLAGIVWISFVVLAPGAVALDDACVQDAQRLCPQTPGAGLDDCLRGMASRVSPECRTALDTPRAPLDRQGMNPEMNRSASLEPCKGDFQLLCPDLSSSSRREAIVECLKSHELSLSRECSDTLAAASAPRGVPGQFRPRGRRGF